MRGHVAAIRLRPTIALSLVAFPAMAIAGPIAMIDSLFTMFYVYVAIMVVVALVAFVLCGRIRNRSHRALARLAVLVIFFTPIPLAGLYGTSSFSPAFVAWLHSLNLSGSNRPGTGLFAYPFALAYALTFGMFAPIVLAWTRTGGSRQRD